jgi:signal transduction histidine kinase
VTSLARRAHGLVVETLQGKYEREELACQLSAANHQLALSNDELADANARLRSAYEAVNDASLAKSKFLANMSHELRTPLNAIIGFSEIMEAQLFGPIGEARYREYAKDIHESGAHLLTVINDILDLSKIEAGELTLQEGLVDLVDVLGRCLRLVAQGAEKGRLTLSSHFEEGVPLLFGDEGRVRQIGFNLISNAIKFTPPGGRVGVSLARADCGDIVIEIADTGIGMRPEDIPIALQSFRQIDSELTRSQQGTGLGLPLSKTLVELHDGQLEISSEPGAGTVVRVTFPHWRARPHPLYLGKRLVAG